MVEPKRRTFLALSFWPTGDPLHSRLYGRFLMHYRHQTLYHRRVRNTNCVVGKQEKAAEKVIKNCPCSKVDFEWSAILSSDPAKPPTYPLPVNSITFGMTKTNVSFSREPYLCPVMNPADMTKSTGMSARLI